MNIFQREFVNTKRFYSIQFLTWGFYLFKEIEEPIESFSENIIESGDESWTPSMDASTQDEVEEETNEVEEETNEVKEETNEVEGEMNEVEEEMNEVEEADEVEKEVDAKVDNLERGKERSKVKKTSGEHEVSTSQRRKIPCPLLTCKAEVVHLPRHMRNVHHWTQEAASKVLLKYNIRRRLKKDTSEKDYRRRRKWPIADCHSVVRRLPKHLQKVHKFDKASREYKNAISDAPIAPKRKHGMIRWQEDRLKIKKWDVEKSPQHSKEHNEHSKQKISTGSGHDNLEEIKIVSEQENEKIDDHDDDDDVVDDDDDDYDDGDEDGDDDSDDDENDDDDYDNNDDYDGSDAVPSTSTLPPLIAEFQDWLASPDGSKKDPKTVMQHGSQLFIMLKAIDDSENIKSLLDLKLIRHLFLNKHVKDKKYEAGTIKSYLMSLRHFYSFLLSDKPGSITFNWLDVSASREKVKMWSASYKRESSTRKWQKLEEDMLNRLTPSNIRKLEKSTAAREAIKIIGKYSDSDETTPVTQSGFTLVRDFLFTQIFIDNANRPGVLAHMTMDEYNKMRKQDDHYVITVKKHKTAHVHGPARIVLSEKLKSWMSVFVGVIRAHVTTTTSGPVFLSWNGNAMKSGHITKAVQSVFKKAGLDVKITSTSFRKAAVTKVHIDKPDMSGKLANLMAHNEATAKKYYLLTEKSKTSVEVSKNLGRLMRTDDGNTETTRPTASPTKDVKDVEEKEVEGKDKSSESETPKRIPWSDDDVAKIKKIFKDDIINDSITLDVVRRGVETNEELRGMSPRRIYDKLKKDIQKDSNALVPVREPPQEHQSMQDKLERLGKNLTNWTNSEQAATIHDDQASTSIIAPTERNSSFNDNEVGTIHSIFKDMICENTTISRVEVDKRCSSSRDGRNLLQKSTSLALVNRIKYERRKYRLGLEKKRQ